MVGQGIKRLLQLGTYSHQHRKMGALGEGGGICSNQRDEVEMGEVTSCEPTGKTKDSMKQQEKFTSRRKKSAATPRRKD